MLQFFETETQTSDIPFLSDLMKEPEGKKLEGSQHVVNEVLAVSSGKGYLIRTDRFITFIWKKQKTTTQLLEALNYYFEAGTGYTLCAVIDSKVKGLCKLGVDFDSPSYWQKKGENFYNSISAIITEANLGTENPFLPPTFPLNQPRSLEQADAIGATEQISHQTIQNGSRTSQKASKAQSYQKGTNRA